eukprot:1136178-Rhodomonas_salina.1
MHGPKGYGQCERGRQQQDRHALTLSLASLSAPASNSALTPFSLPANTEDAAKSSGVRPDCITSIHRQQLVQA